MTPYLSVIITGYRRRTFIAEAVRSVLAQSVSRSEFEVVVIKDFAEPFVDSLAATEPNVKVVTQDIPVLGEMIVRALELCQGEVVCFLDDDDTFRPTKLAHISGLFQEDPGLVYVRHAMDEMDESGKPVTLSPHIRTPITIPTVLETSWSGRTELWKLVQAKADAFPSAMSFRIEALKPWYREISNIPTMQDGFLFLLAIINAGRIRLDPRVLSDHRSHPSASRSLLSSDSRKGEERFYLDSARTLETTTHMVKLRGASRTGLARSYIDYRSAMKRLEAHIIASGSEFSLEDWVHLVLWSFELGRPLRSRIWDLSIAALSLLAILDRGVARRLELTIQTIYFRNMA